jgi:DNA-binding response OmpR family regulator
MKLSPTGEIMMDRMNATNVTCVTDEELEVPEERNGIESFKGRGEVILAIEDEEMLRDFLRTLLEESGYKVLLAADGTEGLRTYIEHMNEIHLVLLDMGLPRMSGEEVLSRLLLANPNAKVISVSGSIDPEVQDGALHNGAADYLAKPYMMKELLMKVHQTLHSGVGE